MSTHASEYTFVQADGDAVLTELISKYEELTERTLNPSDPDRLFISWVADIVTQERVLLNYAANQNIPSRAMRENLDALGEFIYGLKRPQAESAECTMRFVISVPQATAVTIPMGTKITDGSQTFIWETKADAIIPIGETAVQVKAICQTPGTVGNGYASGQINLLIDIDNIPFYESCANIDTSSGGSEQADDDTYYELMRQRLEAYSTAGPKGAYEYFAKSVSSDIADVCAINPTNKPGYVNIFAIMQDGSIADDGTKKLIFEACNDKKVRPLTDIVEVLDPEEENFDIDFTFYIVRNSERSVNDISVAVEAAVDEYVKWQTGKIGRDINPSYLIWLLRDTGIKRVDVRKPVYTSLSDGLANDIPQVARFNDIKITNGGYEDE